MLWAEPSRTLDGEQFLTEFLKNADVMVDVGSNIGILSLLAAKAVGPEGRVIAIEAHPLTYRALLENLRLNGITNVSPVNCAVGREDGTVRFSDRIDDDWNKIDDKNGQIEVQQHKLDDVCAGLDHIDVLKIDVEGYELPVLEGGENMLKRTKCILLECWASHTEVFGYQPKDLVKFLEDRSFTGFALTESADSMFLSPLPTTYDQSGLENFVFVRRAESLLAAGISFLKSVNPEDRLSSK
jgi:FkbM family methyltransferase